MWQWLERLLYGPTTAAYGATVPPPLPPLATPTVQEIAQPSLRTSQIFDSHIVTEATTGRSGSIGKNPQAVSLSWDEGRAYGFNMAPQSWLGMTPRERKETLLSIFLANPWASNCIDTIALYITSGGYTIEPRVEKPDERQHDEIEAFLRRINDDWDFNQLVYELLTDQDVFGESFLEFTMNAGKPYQLFPIDCLTMDTRHDIHGRVIEYRQQLTSTSVTNVLDPKTIIRWWNPHKRAKVDPISTLERVQDSILLDKKMVNWTTNFFQKGAKFPFSIEGMSDQDEADRFLTWFKANYTGEKNAQNPFVSWGGAKITPLGKGSIDIDFDKGLDRQQMIVLSAFHVPPSIACIAESGNRLTDMSDGQRKILQYIACDPRRHRFFEKFNYRLIYPFFGEDWYVSSRYADFRDDKALAEVADIRVKNGTLTQNEVRQEMGKSAYKKGGDVPAIVTNKEVTPIERLDDLADEQRQTSQATLDTAKANADLAQTKAKQAKEPPPEPVAPIQQNGPPQQPAKQQNERDAQGQEGYVDLDSLEEHLPGRHDQLTHGHGGGGGTIPTADQLSGASYQKFGETKNNTYKTEIKGKTYFVKRLANPSDAVNEVAATSLAQAMSLSNNIVPIATREVAGKTLAISPWRSLTPLEANTEAENTAIVGALSDAQFSQMHAFEYLSGDIDRYSQNIAVDTSTNQLRMLDFGYAFARPNAQYTFEESALSSYRADALGVTEPEVPLNTNALSQIVANEEAILKSVQGVNAAKVQGVKDRLATLKAVSQLPHATLQDLYNVANQGQTPTPGYMLAG